MPWLFPTNVSPEARTCWKGVTRNTIGDYGRRAGEAKRRVMGWGGIVSRQTLKNIGKASGTQGMNKGGILAPCLSVGLGRRPPARLEYKDKDLQLPHGGTSHVCSLDGASAMLDPEEGPGQEDSSCIF